MNFMQALRARWVSSGSLVCVGLDPDPTRFPARFDGDPDEIFAFCRDIVDATAEYVCCFKPQIACFSAHRAEGALERLIAHIHDSHLGIPVILDAKRGDIGSTARHYAAEAFDRYRADAVTVNPYLGRDALQPFLDRADKGVVILCRTSNAGAGDLQDLSVCNDTGDSEPLYQRVARTVANEWNTQGNCALVMGATWPDQLHAVRALVGEMPLLVPGIGAQGGDLANVIKNAKTVDGNGLMINSSRAIIYASRGEDYSAAAATAAGSLRDQINRNR